MLEWRLFKLGPRSLRLGWNEVEPGIAALSFVYASAIFGLLFRV